MNELNGILDVYTHNGNADGKVSVTFIIVRWILLSYMRESLYNIMKESPVRIYKPKTADALFLHSACGIYPPALNPHHR